MKKEMREGLIGLVAMINLVCWVIVLAYILGSK